MEATLGSTIKQARAKNNLSRAELARRVSITPNQLLLIEKDKIKQPTMSTLRALSNHLNLDINTLKQLSGYSNDTSSSSTLGTMIKEARLNANISTKELADLAGISFHATRRLENGLTQKARLSTLIAITQVIDLDLEELKEKSGYSIPKVDSLGTAVRKARYNLNMSIEELAELSGLSQGYIYKIEKEKYTQVSKNTLSVLAEILDLDVDALERFVNP